MQDFETFLDEYDELGGRFLRARHQDFPRLVRRFLQSLDGAPEPAASAVRRLRTIFPIERVESEVLLDPEGMVGSGEMAWPDELEPALSGQLNLLASLTDNADAAWNLASNYFYTSSNNIDDILHEMTDHLFEPMVDDLRRYLIQQKDAPAAIDAVPASDRIVRIDHNQPAYQDTIGAIEQTGEAANGDNVILPEDRERIKFELDAGILLLNSSSARLDAVEAVLVRALRWLSSTFAGAALGIAAERALKAVILLLGL